MQHVTTLPQKFSSLIESYLSENEDLSECYSFSPSYEGVKEAYAERSNFPVDRAVLVQVLKVQAESSKYSTKAVFDNIQRIEDGANTVTTGHQLCIYGGPLFFFHKILSAVALAKRLTEDGLDTVPVYWMATEDHDFEEINHVFIGNQKITWEKQVTGPVGRIELDNLETFKTELKALLPSNPVMDDLLQKMDEIYCADCNLTEATRDFVHYIFGHLGVVVIDADDLFLKPFLKEVIADDILKQFSSKALEAKNEFLKNASYTVQVEGREINFFFVEEDYRERIVRHGEGFATADGAYLWSHEEMTQLIQSLPQKFSPNVVLRPVYQELILPNVAYIGGPGEISYWLQLKDVFTSAKAFYPAVLLRDMVVLISEKTKKRMSQTNVDYTDLKLGFQDLFKEKIREKGSHENLVTEVEGAFNERLNELIRQLELLGPDIAESASAEQKKVQNRLEALKKKVLRKDKRLHTDLERQLQEVFDDFRPSNIPQERFHNWLNYTVNPSEFVSIILPYYNLFQTGLKVIEL